MKTKIVTKLIRFYLFIFFLNILFNNCVIGQTKNYISPKYNYSIDIPINFKKEQPRSINNDLLFIEQPGNSINMIVVKRDFQTKTPHELSKDIFYSMFVDTDPNVKIFDDSKIMVNGIKIYKYVKTMTFKGNPDKLNQVSFIYYNGNFQFILTLTCATKEYDKYKTKFDAVGKSLKFK